MKHKPETLFHGVTALLPVNTWGFSLRDELGNVSSTHATRLKQNTEVQIQPRFPIFGQWNSTWLVEYNLYTEDLVKYDDNSGNYIFDSELKLPYGNIPARLFN